MKKAPLPARPRPGTGRFEEAAGGTVFLDEIGELELALQAKLLRVLQERTIERLGSNRKIKVDFRLISSTNRNLKQEIANGTFREDLFYRINVVQIDVPPLRDRTEDIPQLASAFVDHFCRRERKAVTLSDQVARELQTFLLAGQRAPAEKRHRAGRGPRPRQAASPSRSCPTNFGSSPYSSRCPKSRRSRRSSSRPSATPSATAAETNHRPRASSASPARRSIRN